MSKLMSLPEAIGRFVHDGTTLALEGFTHLIPFAAAHEIIRQQRRNLCLVRMTPDLIYDQMIGMGCASRLVFSWGGNPGVGSLHRFRDAVENAWPAPLELDERSHADVANSYVAGAANLPFSVMRGHTATDLPQHNQRLRSVVCPFTGERLAASPSIRPDVTIIHAQKADRRGNVLMWGIVGVQKEAALAARQVIVTVEEIVDDLEAWPNACVLPAWTLSAVCLVPSGAFPSYAQDYYERDNRFYKRWDAISRDRDTFLAWMQRHVMQTRDWSESLALMKSAARAEQAA